MTQIKILLSVPNKHWIHKFVVNRVITLLGDKRYKTTLIMPSHKPYVCNLHHIVKDFMDSDYDFWLNIDADNPPSKNPLDLVELKKDIIGVPTPIWHFKDEKKGERPVYWNAYDLVDDATGYREHQDRNGLQKVDAVGTGCILIARRVFENPEMRKAPFMRRWTEEGLMERGNDMAFCERARKNGFEIYAHFGYWCDHFSELSMHEMHRAYREMYEGVKDG